MKHIIKKGLIASLVAAASVLAASSALAGTATASFQVTATVNATCVISATNVAFGAITPASTGTATSTGSITSTCTNSTPYTLAINAGSGTIPARSMAGALTGNTDKLAYNVYTDAAKTIIFGDGTTGNGSKVSLTGNGAAQTTSVYGSMALSQYLKPDSYTDNLTVTLTY